MLKQDIPLVMLRTLTNPEQLAVDMFNGEPLPAEYYDIKLEHFIQHA